MSNVEQKTYTKTEALALMLSGETMKYIFNSNFNYYYLNGKFYCAGEGEWNPNESSNDIEWVIIN